MVPYELLQDLNKLACTSKNKKIENLFVKLANQVQDQFYDWLFKVQNYQPILEKLSRNNTLPALVYLAQSDGKDPSSLPADYRVAFTSFKNLMGYLQFQSIFNPYYKTLSAYEGWDVKGGMTKEESQVQSDLNKLLSFYEEYRKGGLNTKEDVDRVDGDIKKKSRAAYLRSKKVWNNAYRFFFTEFTKEITKSLEWGENGSTSGVCADPLMQNVYQLVTSGNLGDPNKIMSAMPHFPDMGSSDQVILGAIRDIGNIGSYQSSGNESVVDVFNKTRERLFESLDISADYDDNYDIPESPDYGKQQKDFFNENELSNEFVDNFEIQENKNQPPVDYHPSSTSMESYIIAVSVLLRSMWRKMYQIQESEKFLQI